MDNQQALVCALCSAEMRPQKTQFEYLGHSFQADVPCCPVCGQVYITEELALGRISDVESELEDK